MTGLQWQEHNKLWNDYKAHSEMSRMYFKRYMKCKSQRGKEKNWELMKEQDVITKEIREALKPYHQQMIEDEKRIKEMLEEV